MVYGLKLGQFRRLKMACLPNTEMMKANINTDGQTRAKDWRRRQLAIKRGANGSAPRTPASESFTAEDARALRGIGWDGNLDEMRSLPRA